MSASRPTCSFPTATDFPYRDQPLFFGSGDLEAERRRYNATQPRNAQSLQREAVNLPEFSSHRRAGAVGEPDSNTSSLTITRTTTSYLNLEVDASFPALERVTAHEADPRHSQQQQRRREFEYLLRSFHPMRLEQQQQHETETETDSLLSFAAAKFAWCDNVSNWQGGDSRQQDLFERRLEMVFRELNRKGEGRWRRWVGRACMWGRRMVGL